MGIPKKIKRGALWRPGREAAALFAVRLAAHVSNGLKSRIRPVVGRTIMTKDYMQNFNPPGRSYLTGILKGCRQNQIPTEPILKAARKPPVPGKTQKSQPKKQRKAGQER